MTQRLSHAGIEAIIAMLVNRDYEGYISSLMVISGVALSIYATLIRIDDEMEYVWFKPFTFPTLLYFLGRYNSTITQIFAFISMYTTPGKPSDLANVANVTFCLSYIGYIDLIVARTYSLCRNKFFIVPLMLSFGAGFFFLVFKSIAFSGCFVFRRIFHQLSLDSDEEILMTLLLNLSSLVTDFLVFGMSLYKIWDTWYLKRKTRIQMGNDLASILLKQTISRFLFAILLNLSLTIVRQLQDTGKLLQGLGALVQALGPVLVANYMLDLRRHNSKAIQANYASLPPIQSIQDVVQHIQQSIRVEMAEEENGDANANLILLVVRDPNTTTKGVECD